MAHHWQLYAVAFTTGVLTVFFDVAYQSYLPSLVGREHLVDGNSKLEISQSVAHIGGPGLAGDAIFADDDLFQLHVSSIPGIIAGEVGDVILLTDNRATGRPQQSQPSNRYCPLFVSL